jgi:hypothetical protein
MDAPSSYIFTRPGSRLTRTTRPGFAFAPSFLNPMWGGNQCRFDAELSSISIAIVPSIDESSSGLRSS